MEKELLILQKEAQEIIAFWKRNHPLCKFQNIPYSISWNNRLKVTAGIIRYRTTPIKIELSTEYFFKFGMERSRKTLKHELAHYIACAVYDHTKHTDTFKQICNELGGSMNCEMAGEQFKESATDQYIKKEKIVYECPCGYMYKQKNRMNPKRHILYRCPKCHTSLAKFKIQKEGNKSSVLSVNL